MSGPPRVRSTNVAESEPPRPVLRPAGNNAPSVNTRNAASKPSKKAAEKPQREPDTRDRKILSTPPGQRKSNTVRAVLLQQEMKVGPNLAMNASCSSDASSSDSSYSRASSGRFVGKRIGIVPGRRKECSPKAGSLNCVGIEKVYSNSQDCGSVESTDGLEGKKRCSWVTPNTDPSYVAFHDEEWGLPVHDDKKLFELLCLSGALAELTWPAILTKRHLFREVFLDFDPTLVSKLSEKKIVAQGSPASSLLSEPKLRGIIENARQICKIMEEFGSFNSYIWNFVNHKPVVSQFRYPRQVPVKTSKAEFISKDLVRRGFRSVGPTVLYSFMQVAGLTNDHLTSCFRFLECTAGAEVGERDGIKPTAEVKRPDCAIDVGLPKVMDKLSSLSN